MSVWLAVGFAIYATFLTTVGVLMILHRRRSGRFQGAAALPGLVGLIMAAPCFALGFLFGGNFGGALLAGVAEQVGFGKILIPIGIGLGIWFVFTLLEVLIVGAVGMVVLRRTTRIGS